MYGIGYQYDKNDLLIPVCYEVVTKYWLNLKGRELVSGCRTKMSGVKNNRHDLIAWRKSKTRNHIMLKPMKKNQITVAFASALVLASSMAYAQLPVSRTAGVELTSLSTGFQFVAFQFANEPVARGTVTNISGNDLTLDTGAIGSLTNGVARVASGPSTGQVMSITGTSGSTITVDDVSVATIDDDLTQIEVLELETLDSAFPGGGDLATAGTPGNADQLYLIDGGSLLVAYYNSTAGEWRDAGDESAVGSVALPLNGSFLVNGSPTPGDLIASGIAPSGDQIVDFTAGNFTFVGSPYESGLTLGDLTSSVTAAGTPGNADQIYYVDAGSLIVAYRNTAGEWRNAGDESTLADSSAIGEAFLVLGAVDGSFTFVE